MVVDNKTNKTGLYTHKNLTVHIKREYGENRKLSDIITNLIMQDYFDNNRKSA